MSFVPKNYSTDGGDTWVVGGKLKIEDGAEVTGLESGEGYTLPEASASVLGGVKVGSGLAISDGVLSVSPAENQADSTATELADLVTAFNALLAKLKAAGLMAADA